MAEAHLWRWDMAFIRLMAPHPLPRTTTRGLAVYLPPRPWYTGRSACLGAAPLLLSVCKHQPVG